MKKLRLFFIIALSVFLFIGTVSIFANSKDISPKESKHSTFDNTSDNEVTKYNIEFYINDLEYNTQSVNENTSATLPTEPTKEGYRFVGWSINGTDIVENIETTPVTGNTTYTAVFQPVCIVTYMVNDEVYLTQTVDSETKPVFPTNLENNGDLQFIGWVTEANYNIGNYEYYTEAYEPVNENTTFYAYYAKCWTVTTIVLDETTSWKVVEGQALNIFAPEIDGYTFKYWSYDGETDCGLNLEIAYIKEDTTFIAVFEIIPETYTVIFNDDNGYISDSSYVTGDYITLPTNPTKDGYRFIGWGYDGSDDIIKNIESTPVEKLQSDSANYISLCAKFELL